MSLISLQSASFDFGREVILRQVNLNVFAGVKYALVGANGVGKTTLLSLLAGDLPLQRGKRQVSGKLSIRRLRQETAPIQQWDEERTLYDNVLLQAFAKELELEQELADLTEILGGAAEPAEQEALIERQGLLQAEFERYEGYTLRPRLETALRGVGLGPDFWQRPVSRLSGGERRRAALASILLTRADLLLLDEPTNHLDLESCEWIEHFIQQYPGAAVLVSHDREFLDRTAEQTVYLEHGKVILFNGNYTFFERANRQHRRQQLEAYERQQEKIRRTEDFIQRNLAGQKTKQAQSRRRQLAREELVDKPVTERSGFRLSFAPAQPSGSVVLQAEGIHKGYGGRQLIRNLDLLVTRGERVGIVGPNGCGKTTLLRLLSGRELADSGTVKSGHNVDLGFYDQQLLSVSDHHLVMEELAAVDPAATIGQLRSRLAAFGFDTDKIDRPVGRLSGGERGRLALLRLITEGHNTLLLDEPTNHLDISSRESLEEALTHYDGTLIVVSHDRRFLDKIVERLIVFPAADSESAGRVTLFLGNYHEYHQQREAQLAMFAAENRRQAVTRPATSEKAGRRQAAITNGLSKNEQARRQQWIASVEEEISALETERNELLAQMAAADLETDARVIAARQCAEIEQGLAEKLALWEKWHQEIEAAEPEH
ncbi:MAG: ABC-F family ATP-binding cassette domain-containing protein [bacterium]